MKTLVVLAGGKSTRMGKDKVFLHIHNGESFLEAIVNNAAAWFDRVIISAGSMEHAQKIREHLKDAEVIPDRYPEKGPMGGLVSVFEKTGADAFAVVAADVPGADMEVLSFLYDKRNDAACLLQNRSGKAEPLIGAYGRRALLAMQKLLAEGNYRIRAAFPEDTVFYSIKELCSVFPEKTEEELEQCFCNINTEEEYRKHLS